MDRILNTIRHWVGYLHWLTHSATHSLLTALSSTQRGFSKPCVTKLENWLSKFGLTSEEFPIHRVSGSSCVIRWTNACLISDYAAILLYTSCWLVQLSALVRRVLQQVRLELTTRFRIVHTISSEIKAIYFQNFPLFSVYLTVCQPWTFQNS